MRLKKSRILDQYGKPVAYSDFFQGGRRWGYGDTKSTYWNQGVNDTEQLLPTSVWREMMSNGRFLFANVPILRGALLEQASLSFPLEAQYSGRDKAWGRRAEAWLWTWRKSACVKGRAFSDVTWSRIRLFGRKIDGDIATVLTMTANGYPRLQFVRAHRIGDVFAGEVKSGPYAGRRIRNGVVLTPWGAPEAYCILDDQGEPQYVSANSMFLTYRPDYSDQDRGISELCACITSFEDLKRLREYEMRAQMLGASIGILEKNELGAVDEASLAITHPDSATDASGTGSGLITETYEAGTIRYFKSGTGSGLEAFRNDRPSADAQAFEDRIISAALYGIEWDANFALAVKQPGGALARIMLEKVRKCIASNQEIEIQARYREDVYGLAKAIKEGYFEAPADGDIFSWDYKAPARLTADTGNEENAKRERYKLGLVTMRDLEAEQGRWWEETREQRLTEAIDLLDRSKRLQAMFPEMTLPDCVMLLEQRNPNGVIAATETAQPQMPDGEQSALATSIQRPTQFQIPFEQ